MTNGFSIELLASKHDRRAFSCGVEPLDRYLHTQAGQDARRRVSNCFVAVPADGVTIAGYYTLSASSIPFDAAPEELRHRLPSYPLLPAALIGRLAVDLRYRRKSLGSALLFDALARASRADPAVFALVVDAKDDSAADFYRHFGFLPLSSRPRAFVLPIATAMKLMEK